MATLTKRQAEQLTERRVKLANELMAGGFGNRATLDDRLYGAATRYDSAVRGE